MATEISSISSLLDGIGEDEGKTLWFRGHAKADWPLLPGFFRTIPHPQEETEILKKFKQSSHLLLERTPDSSFDWLIWMQHYGVPTRLLDWTESPLAALYFAVESPAEQEFDGSFWALDPVALNKNSGIGDEHEQFIPSFEDTALKNYAPEALQSENKTSLSPIAAIATRSNPRIQAQLGVFTIFHRKKDAIDKIGNGSHVKRFIIPSAAKPVILRELNKLSINRFTMFPELASIGHNIRTSLGL